MSPHICSRRVAGRTDSEFAAVEELSQLHVLHLAGERVHDLGLELRHIQLRGRESISGQAAACVHKGATMIS